MDKLTGLLSGYSFVNNVVSHLGIKMEIADQVRGIGNCLRQTHVFWFAQRGPLRVGGFRGCTGARITPV
jgi:hypothetical protein